MVLLDRSKILQLSLLRTPFSWTGHFSRKKLGVVLLDRPKNIATQSFADTLLLDRSFFKEEIRGGSPGQAKKYCNSVFCGQPSPGQVIFQGRKLGVVLLDRSKNKKI